MTAPERGSEHEAVGAYALGVLDPGDAERFEDHLAGCPPCQAQLDEFLGLEPLLATLAGPPGGDLSAVPAALPVRPGDGLLDRLVDEVATARRTRRRRALTLVAAAAVLIVGGPVVGAVLASDDTPRDTARPAPTATADPAPGDDVLFDRMPERLQGRDPATGAVAAVGLRRRGWGTDAVLRLGGVKGPKKCSLIAVAEDGEEQTLTTWYVPAEGYGIEDSAHAWARRPLYAHGGTALRRADIDRFEVRTLDGERLVTVDG